MAYRSRRCGTTTPSACCRPAAIDARTQYRRYASRQLQELATILALKNLGASLDDIRRVIGRDEARRERARAAAETQAQCAESRSRRRSARWRGSTTRTRSCIAEREVPIVLKQRPAIRVASVRAQARSYAAIGAMENDFRRAIDPAFAGREQGVLWHRCAASGVIEGEPFTEIAARAPRTGAYELKELPSATVASAYCEPDDDDAIRVYGALDRWHPRCMAFGSADRSAKSTSGKSSKCNFRCARIRMRCRAGKWGVPLPGSPHPAPLSLQDLDLVDVRQVLSVGLEPDGVHRAVVERERHILCRPRGPGAGGIERDVLRDAIHQHASGAAGGRAQRITDADAHGCRRRARRHCSPARSRPWRRSSRSRCR